MARSSQGHSGLSRAVRVLEAFNPSRSELTLTQIAARTGMPTSTVHGIVAELVGLGLLERRGRELLLGVKLWELAVRAPGVFGLRETALPYLEQLRDKLQQHAQLGILQGAEVLYLERLSAPESAVNFTAVGGRIPWYATSSGLVLVAGQSPEEENRILELPRPRYATEPAQSTSSLRARVAKARSEGHAVTSGFIHPESTAIAVPVRGPYGQTVAALAVVVPADGFQIEPVLAALAPAARTVGLELKRSLTGM
ncbi:IclR family transcriptional regulator [Arthrobacter sp. Sa2BUA2]|uniref:IclR family transcriptional regulator n=1 Tax=Arthrobacter pullicola TaxID=2762224 RepID=A0ABR8YE44_9MICC|nr:IclR family transcriptional regulator [Arthrobacter pullicola]MBD8042467.1 IclR family transcriptional regulator [Arthrobacter pullicola]